MSALTDRLTDVLQAELDEHGCEDDDEKRWQVARHWAERVVGTLPATIDAAHIDHQRAWSEATFGPGPRTQGVVDHIRRELVEILSDPTDLKEWVDAIILAFDGAWRTGAASQEIVDAIKAKQAKNELREWPDWRTAPADKAIEHVREES